MSSFFNRQASKAPQHAKLSRKCRTRLEERLGTLGGLISKFSESPTNFLDWAFVEYLSAISRHVDYAMQAFSEAFAETNRVP